MPALRDEIKQAGFKNAELMYTTLEGEEKYDTHLFEKDFSAYKPDP